MLQLGSTKSPFLIMFYGLSASGQITLGRYLTSVTYLRTTHRGLSEVIEKKIDGVAKIIIITALKLCYFDFLRESGDIPHRFGILYHVLG